VATTAQRGDTNANATPEQTPLSTYEWLSLPRLDWTSMAVFYEIAKTMPVVTAVACFLSTKIWALESPAEKSKFF
jgi:hypothetical protein